MLQITETPLRKFFRHGCGIWLVAARTSADWFPEVVAPNAELLFFSNGKTKFVRPDGSIGKEPGTGVVLNGRDRQYGAGAIGTWVLRAPQGHTMTARERLPDRRPAETFELVARGLKYTCTVGRFADGRIGELFLGNHKVNSAADTSARDAAITFSIAIQHGAGPETIRSALCRDSHGRASGPLGVALDIIMGSAP